MLISSSDYEIFAATHEHSAGSMNDLKILFQKSIQKP